MKDHQLPPVARHLSGEGKRIRITIKEIMKRRRLRYRDMARLLQVSEPTIKRLMSREDISLERLIRIADWLGLSVSELLDPSVQEKARSSTFTEKQEAWLATQPQAFLHFHHLLNGYPPDQADALMNLKGNQGPRLRLALEKHDLLELGAGDRPRIKARVPLSIRPGGPLEKSYFSTAVRSILNHTRARTDGYRFAGEKDDGLLFRPFEAVLSEETYREMTRELNSVIDKYRTASRLELLFKRRDRLKQISGIILSDFYNCWPNALKNAPKLR